MKEDTCEAGTKKEEDRSKEGIGECSSTEGEGGTEPAKPGSGDDEERPPLDSGPHSKCTEERPPAVPDKVTENFLQVTLARGVLFQTVGPLPEEASANGDAKENN